MFTLITGQKTGVLAVKKGLFTHKFTVKPPFIAWCDTYFLPVGVNIKEYSNLFSKNTLVCAESRTCQLFGGISPGN